MGGIFLYGFQSSDPSHSEDSHLELLPTLHSVKSAEKGACSFGYKLLLLEVEWAILPAPDLQCISFKVYSSWYVFPRFWTWPQDNCLSSFWNQDKWEDVSCLPDSCPNFFLCSVKLLAKFFPLVVHILTDVRAPSAKICKQLAFMFEHSSQNRLKLKFSEHGKIPLCIMH